jgi:hypothetical protein
MSGKNKHSRDNEEDKEDSDDMEKCIKRLRVNVDNRVDIPRSKPHNRRLPAFDGMDDGRDIDYTQVNSVLKELAEMREFRSRMKSASGNTTRLIFERDDDNNDDMKQE